MVTNGITRNSFSKGNNETKKIERRTSKLCNQENMKIPQFNQNKVLLNLEKRNSNPFPKE
jgi:hypothetical protein